MLSPSAFCVNRIRNECIYMILSNLPQSFRVYFRKGYIYPEVRERWEPLVRKLDLPYMSVEDFMNSLIKTISMPSLTTGSVTQMKGRNTITKLDGYSLEESVQKTFNITFKVTESYLSYLIMMHQLKVFRSIFEKHNLYQPPVYVDYFDDNQIVCYRQAYLQVTPLSISELPMTYSAQLSQYTEFTMSFAYNYLDQFLLVGNELQRLND